MTSGSGSVEASAQDETRAASSEPPVVAGPILSFEGTSKAFFGIDALSDVSFSVTRGHILGLVGENGAGKSTLMNILGGVVPATAGQMLLNGKAFEPG